MLLLTFYLLLDISCFTHALRPVRLVTRSVVWTPEGEGLLHLTREESTCSGVSGLTSCGISFPDDFCCATGASCLRLNTSSLITAAICCPAGQNCEVISPISCTESLQNATTNPTSEVHVTPLTALDSCGSACCPPGYTCSNGDCYAQRSSTLTSSSSSAATVSATPSSSAATLAAGSTVATETATAASSSSHATANNFSGASFAAGFVPGIVLGALAAACVLLLCFRRRRRSSRSNEKHFSTGHDTLTDLGPSPARQPTVHGRSISEPTVDMDLGYRTDFYHRTPLRQPEQVTASTYTPNPVTPATRAQQSSPASKGLFSHSPFMYQAQTPVPALSPIPNHLKRGTLSFQISPVRALRKQRSMHSLRRHLTDATSRSNSSRRRGPGVSRSASTETIKVLMHTPEHAPRHLHDILPSSGSSARDRSPAAASQSGVPRNLGSAPVTLESPLQSHYPSSSRYPSQTTSPPQQSVFGPTGTSTGQLGTPYTPSNYVGAADRVRGAAMAKDDGLKVYREPLKRDTTFSAMMERAGLRRSHFIGTGEAS